MLEPGSEHGGFRIERLLGRGGMGEVYEARQLTLDRDVALKVLDPTLCTDEGFRTRFRREGRRQATLDHPNVVTVYEAGEIDAGLYLAMRLVRGVTLKQLIGGGEIDPARALRLLTPVAAALDAAHELGLVHRDVKPQNILVRDDDHPFLADFGLTRGLQDTALTATGQFIGTIDYIAPEILRGESAGPAADVYALAGVLYECLTGQVPFPRESEVSVLYAHVHEPPPAATTFRPDLPPAIDDVLREGMAKEPADRSSSAGALLAAATAVLRAGPSASLRRVGVAESPLARGLRPVLGETRPRALPPAAGTTPTRAVAVAGSAPRRRLILATMGSAAAVALLALAGVAGYRGGSQTTLAPLSITASSAAVSLSAPVGWAAVAADATPSIPGLTLRELVSLQGRQFAASGVIAGVADGAGQTLLPADLRRRVEGVLPAPTAVQLGHAQALRYANVRVRGFDRVLTLHAIPVGDSTVIVGCYAARELVARFSAACGRVTGSVVILRGAVLPLGGDTTAVRRLMVDVETFGRRRQALRLELKQARTPARQASAAAALHVAALDVEEQVGRVGGGAAAAPDRAAAGGALHASARAYMRLANAARSGDRHAYDLASSQVIRAESRVSIGLQALDGRLAKGVGRP